MDVTLEFMVWGLLAFRELRSLGSRCQMLLQSGTGLCWPLWWRRPWRQTPPLSRQCCTTRSKSPSPLPRPSRCPRGPRPLQSMSLRLRGSARVPWGFLSVLSAPVWGGGPLRCSVPHPRGSRCSHSRSTLYPTLRGIYRLLLGSVYVKLTPCHRWGYWDSPWGPSLGWAGMCQCASRPRNSRWSELCSRRLNKFICKCRSPLKIKIKKVKVN